jgi:hypothetical protein
LEGEAHFTTFTYKVRYSSSDGIPPDDDSPRVVIDGVGTFQMQPESWCVEEDYKNGRVYSFSIKLPPGNYRYYFEAEDARGVKAVGIGTKVWGGPNVKMSLPYISGHILDKDKKGMEGVEIVLSGDEERVIKAGEDGAFTFWSLKKGGSYTIQPKKDGYVFLPKQRVYVSIKKAEERQNFIALPIEKGEVKVLGGLQGYIMADEGEFAQIHLLPSESGQVMLRIYNLRGTLVWKHEVDVVEGENKRINWHCVNNSGKPVASGIYLLRIKGAGFNLMRKIAIIR